MLMQKWIDFAKYGEQLKNELNALDFNPQRAVEMLSKMGIGMLVIFVVIGIIAAATIGINKAFSKKEDK